MNLELKRTPDDRDLYTLEHVGTLRLEGLFSTQATAQADGNRWRIARRGFWRELQATDAAGAVVGVFERRVLGGGKLRWGDRDLTVQRASLWRERYALADGDRELALLDAKDWGRQPVTITVDHPAALPPGLLLFAAFVINTLVADAPYAGAAAAVTASTG